jgi:DNA-binding transcriptional ArsR family regulator
MRSTATGSLGALLLHPLRHRLLLEYSREPTNPGELARRLERPLNSVSYHTNVLLRHGYLELVRTERRRGAPTRFFHAPVMAEIDDAPWESLPEAVRRALTLGSLAQIAGESRRAALDGGLDVPGAHLSRTALELDDEGAQEVADCLRTAVVEVMRIAAESRERGGARVPWEVVLLGFEQVALTATNQSADPAGRRQT